MLGNTNKPKNLNDAIISEVVKRAIALQQGSHDELGPGRSKEEGLRDGERESVEIYTQLVCIRGRAPS